MTEPTTEQRLRRLEGQTMAQQAVLTLLIGHVLGRAKPELDPHRDMILQGIERLYGKGSVTDRGDEVLQVAMHTVEQLFEC